MNGDAIQIERFSLPLRCSSVNLPTLITPTFDDRYIAIPRGSFRIGIAIVGPQIRSIAFLHCVRRAIAALTSREAGADRSRRSVRPIST